ncbi:MAG: WD40/YVTN/BNR-like repeat-containing protein [Bacteroidota bacterium]
MKKLFLPLCFLVALLPSSQAQEISGKSLLSGLRARQIGPASMSGRIADIDVVNKKPQIIYVGTAGGGVWKSVSAGASFRPVFDDYTQSIGKVTIDQNNPDTVWVGTGEPWVRNSVGVGTGVYKTVNGGRTWEFMGLKDSEHISDILVHPKDGNIVYVGVQGHLWGPNQERGVFKTTDGGKTWTKILYVDENTGCAEMEMDPKNPEVIYAAMWSHRRYPDFFDSGFTGGSALMKSTDGGKTWNKIHNGLPTTMFGRIAVAAAPSNPNVLYASVEAAGNKVKTANENKGLYKSTDAGASWKKINSDFNNTVRPFYFSRVVVDPTTDSILVKCAFVPIISTDGGNKFRQIGSGVHSDIHAAWIDPNNNQHILLGTDGGVYESFDQAYSFKMWMNLPVGQFYHVAVDNEVPFNVYGGLQDNGSWWGPSQKAGGITNADWKGTFGGDGFWSHPNPKDPNTVYAEYQGGHMVRYHKKTGVAKDIRPYPEKGGPKLRFNWNTPMVQSPNKADRIYAGAQFLFMSDDQGDSWKRISPDLTTNDPKRQRQSETGGISIDNSSAENNATIYAIAESPKDEKLIWVGTDDGLLQVTENQGTTWTNVTKNIVGLPAGNWCSRVEPSNIDRNTAYVSFDNHRNGDMKPYIYKTTDLGKTWTSIVTSEIEGHVFVIREDLKNPNLLFAGTEFGLYLTLNGGKKWIRFDNNLPKSAPVHDVVIHPRDNSLVIATHGRSLYIVDDISPLRQLTEEVLAKGVHFFEVNPTVLRDPGAGSEWFGGDGNFVGENPSPNASIVYYMSKRHTFGKMSVEVYDQDGKLLKELPAGKSAGINVVEMPANIDRPKVAPSDTRESLGGSIFGPNLAAGTYKVKVIKGKEEFWTNFTLKYPEDSPYTAADRKLQRETTMRLYKLTEQLAYIYHVQYNLVQQAKNAVQKNAKLAKSINPYIKEIEDQNSKLVFKGGDFYVATEEKLTENIAELYGQVNGYPGRPGNSQIERAEGLEAEMRAVEQKFNEFKGAKLEKVNNALSGAKMDPLKVVTEEEFRKDSNAGTSASSKQLQKLFRNFQLLR